MDGKKLLLYVYLCMSCISQLKGMYTTGRQLAVGRRLINGSKYYKKEGPISLLPEEDLECVIKYAIIASPGTAGVLPNVSTTWERIANGPVLVRDLVNNQRPLLRIRGLLGASKYQATNAMLYDMCEAGASFESIGKVLEQPDADVNCVVGGRHKDVYGTVLRCAIRSSKPELVTFLLDHGAKTDVDNFGFSSDLSCSFFLAAKDHIESNTKVFKVLRDAGAKDNGDTLVNLMELCRIHPEYYSMVLDEDLKDLRANVNHRMDLNNQTALHALLNPEKKACSGVLLNPPDAHVLEVLMRDHNANPHIKNCFGESSYQCAQAWADAYRPEYLQIVQKYDKGIEWYEKNQNQ